MQCALVSDEKDPKLAMKRIREDVDYRAAQVPVKLRSIGRSLVDSGKNAVVQVR